MKAFADTLRKLSDEDLYQLTDAMDAELERREQRQIGRGFARSTHGLCIPRDERKAPRSPEARQRAAA